MSTNATLRNNLTKRGSTVLSGNIVNKEKEQNLQNKKTVVINQNLLNGSNNNSTTQNAAHKITVVSKIDNGKLKIKPKENNENDKNLSNIYLKRKLTIDVENTKRANNSYILNNQQEKEGNKALNPNTTENEINADMNVSMKEIKEEDFQSLSNVDMKTDENDINQLNNMSKNVSYKLNNNEPKTQRNSVIDPKRSSLPIVADNNFIVKSLLHGEIKKKPNLNNANNISTLGQNSMICEDFIENEISKQSSVDEIPKSSNNPTITTNKLNFKTLISGISINITNSMNNANYSFNLENITISKENQPKFSNEEYRRMFTRMIRKDFGKSFIQNLFAEEESIEDFLAEHKVTERMRTRMIDWMIEVLTNYKCDDNSFFIAVNTMDRYFKACENFSIQPAELHLIGVTSMFMGSKYEDIYPLRLKIVHEKIAHKKLSIHEIKSKESDISTNLNFILGKPSQWDFINQFIEEIFFTNVNNFQITDKSLIENYGDAIGISKGQNGNLLQSFSDYEAEIFKNYTPNMINLFRHVVIYLAKMNCHDYILSTKKPSLIAASTIFVAMKICEQINKEEYVNEYFSKKLTEISQKNENEIIKTAQKILYNAQNFDTIFNGLENLKKIHFNAIIDLKNTK